MVKFIIKLQSILGVTGGFNAMLAEVESLTLKLAEVTKERDEADRRAGAAERNLRYLQEDKYARTCWLDKAKRAAGYHTNVSFDVVWDAALKALLDSRKIEQASQGAILSVGGSPYSKHDDDDQE